MRFNGLDIDVTHVEDIATIKPCAIVTGYIIGTEELWKKPLEESLGELQSMLSGAKFMSRVIFEIKKPVEIKFFKRFHE